MDKNINNDSESASQVDAIVNFELNKIRVRRDIDGKEIDVDVSTEKGRKKLEEFSLGGDVYVSRLVES